MLGPIEAMPMSSQPAPPLHVAIIGGGITGLCLGIGLQSRNIDFTIYERADGIQDVGAGIGLSPNAEWAMKTLAPSVHAAYEKVANPNGEDYFQWVNGLTKETIFKLFVGEGCFRGCTRFEFLEELMRCLPSERVRFGKQVRRIGKHGDGSVLLEFDDETTASADTVIGCDGIRSRIRGFMFKDGPPSAATYSHKFSFRALLPMDQALARLGHDMVSTRYMYNGPGAHIITYPVANNTYLNALAVVSDPNPWDASPDGRQTGRATREEAKRAFAGWHPDVQAIIDLMPAQMDKWAIFDMLENPVPRYHTGARLCLAGDAAHAAGPHLGAGAGFGIEDACLLAELLKRVQEVRSLNEHVALASYLGTAFSMYSNARVERTQWLVQQTREAVDLFEWKEPDMAKDPDKYGKAVTWRYHTIWYYDIDKMIKEATSDFLARLQVNPGRTVENHA